MEDIVSSIFGHFKYYKTAFTHQISKVTGIQVDIVKQIYHKVLYKEKEKELLEDKKFQNKLKHLRMVYGRDIVDATNSRRLRTALKVTKPEILPVRSLKLYCF